MSHFDNFVNRHFNDKQQRNTNHEHDKNVKSPFIFDDEGKDYNWINQRNHFKSPFRHPTTFFQDEESQNFSSRPRNFDSWEKAREIPIFFMKSEDEREPVRKHPETAQPSSRGEGKPRKKNEPFFNEVSLDDLSNEMDKQINLLDSQEAEVEAAEKRMNKSRPAQAMRFTKRECDLPKSTDFLHPANNNNSGITTTSTQAKVAPVDKEEEPAMLDPKAIIELPWIASELSPSAPAQAPSSASDKDEDNDKTSTYEKQTKRIHEIDAMLEDIASKVIQFQGDKRSKEYMLCDEMLTKCLIQLDSIESQGNQQIRSERKAAVLKAHDLVTLLESKIIQRRQSLIQERTEGNE